VATAENSIETAPRVVGRPFPKGVTGNPGGRPAGLARYVRELVGEDGRRIADFMVGVLDDESERTETRMQAAAWLGDRGFGKAVQTTRSEIEQPRPDFASMSREERRAVLGELRGRLDEMLTDEPV
jgi:hypothetical protein